MTALTGDVIAYNRPEVRHETLVAAGARTSCPHRRTFQAQSVVLKAVLQLVRFRHACFSTGMGFQYVLSGRNSSVPGKRSMTECRSSRFIS